MVQQRHPRLPLSSRRLPLTNQKLIPRLQPRPLQPHQLRKAEAKLVKALDYLVAINDNSDNPAQKWVINESILASLTGCFRPAIKKFVETHRSFINQANNTHGLEPGHNRGKARTNPDAIPELVKNFKRDALGQPF
jgi:hypothetical protein